MGRITRNKVIVCCVERSVDEVGKLVDTSVRYEKPRKQLRDVETQG